MDSSPRSSLGAEAQPLTRGAVPIVNIYADFCTGCRTLYSALFLVDSHFSFCVFDVVLSSRCTLRLHGFLRMRSYKKESLCASLLS
jgi:hypothetical protein